MSVHAAIFNDIAYSTIKILISVPLGTLLFLRPYLQKTPQHESTPTICKNGHRCMAIGNKQHQPRT
jgi:hypothetical protein